MKIKNIVLICFLAFSSCKNSQKPKASQAEKNNILCADIGGTRIKAAVLHSAMTLKELQKTPILNFESNGWLNENLPGLFNPTNQGSLPDRVAIAYDQISFGITGPIVAGGLYVNPKNGVPKELKQKCEQEASCPVLIENDAIIWARGALYWRRIAGEKVEFPCLGITLGTNVGVVLLLSQDDMTSIEISALHCPFTRLFAESIEQPKKYEFGKPSPHFPIGNHFFEWVQSEHASWNEQVVQRVFHSRIVAFLEDMQEFCENTLNVQLKAIMIGGGNSRFVSSSELHKALHKQIISLSPQNISQYYVSPDVISLLGCITPPNYQPAKMMPSYEEISEVALKDLTEEASTVNLPF